MAKSKLAKRKQASVAIEPNAKKSRVTVPSRPHLEESTLYNSAFIESLVPEEDLLITIETLQTLSKLPVLIKSKACKDLRVAVYDFRQACTTGLNIDSTGHSNLTAKVTAALADGMYTEARVLLAEMRIRDQAPKLGSICRWVRDLDAVSGLSKETAPDHTICHSAKEKEVLRVLDAILRLMGPIVPHSASPADTLSSIGPIDVQLNWNLRDATVDAALQIYQSVLDGSIQSHAPKNVCSKFRVIETTPGPLRKPPNLYPAILWASMDNTISVDSVLPITRHQHPVVPNLYLLKDVLSPSECVSIVALAETIGFTPDSPSLASADGASILAHNVIWIIDLAFHDMLWNRVKCFLPPTKERKKVRGLNRRFRIYRYVPGAEYRCHIDGAWPPSGISGTDEYIYDSSPPTARQSSLFTFLIYLNDEFTGGETTFFLPSTTEGVMNAYPIRPLQGSVAMFPHGEAVGSLLHEGTGVRQGAKYIIRTDVLYDVDAPEE